MSRDEVLKIEYSEAGQSCRAQESYVRTSLNMFLTLSTAVSGFLALASLSVGAKAYICFVVAGVALCMVLLVLRHRAIYSGLIKRARQIEVELGMTLYSSGEKAGLFDATAKSISALIIGFIGVAYLIAAGVLAYQS